MDNYHITYTGNQWKFSGENAGKSIKNFETKEEAVDYATEFLNEHDGSLKIHTQDGKIEEERTYPRSADPKHIPG
ncbi:DUF2188 domain-containing protein [Fulvivirga sp. RKSG066]|uniref:DUF2188 domain-containing protein n=1 Tax=Fulvivirga aurantia TaxID=2529383 RepID=UPI0012BD1B4A|nr:DUF2188 domain-containing protein [Fulvivirga aurantia]MTI22324.1 DUF2188 domain-containing protein [Fulvivirga aurantia]